MRKIKFIDHTADVAVELSADSIEELFTAGFESWKETVNLFGCGEADKRKVSLEANSLESLLVDFLNEINFFLLTKKWCAERIEKIGIKESKETFKLESLLLGEAIDFSLVQPKEEIKAVTYGGLEIEKKGKEYKARLIFDI